VAEKSDNSGFNERVLAKLLEAAYVVQEHTREKQSSPPLAMEPKEPIPEPTQPERTAAASVEPQAAEPAPVSPPPASVPAAPVSFAAPSFAATPAVSPAAVASRDDYSSTLERIVETQRQIRERRQELSNPMALIAERVCEITRADGAALGILEGETIHYRATAGLITLSGTEVAREKALCALCLQTGQVLRCVDSDSNSDSDPAIDAEEAQRRGIRSMIAVPVFHDGAVAGGLELYYAATHAFTEQDVHTAQLMAGLVTEALAREEEKTWRQSLAGERALMLEALEKLQPNLAALVDSSVVKGAAGQTSSVPPASPKAAAACGKCGHELLDEEQFCGKCGSARGGSYEPPSLQSKVASMWHMQEALKNGVSPANGSGGLAEPAPGFDDAHFEKMLADSLEKEMPELFQLPDVRAGRMWPESLDAHAGLPADELESNQDIPSDDDEEENSIAPTRKLEHEALAHKLEEGDREEAENAPVTALAKPERHPDWSSAASAREFLEQLATERSNGLVRFWHARRGDFYLALAVILVAVVIRWGIWSNHPVSATGAPATAAAQHRKPAPDADLSWFDRVLVKVGLAEAPEPVEYKGKPEIQVWVDLHTALYYCPGTDLYGKTPKGKFTTQRDAQLDQFEPAYRKACE
jgi:putative methionine-R-sulfoxide reductase with GAF domain